VLLDEHKGRHAARATGLTVTGTLAVIQRAAREGLSADALMRLQATNFRVSQRLLNRVRSET
jgi:predicted nucleic acid-binding protein